MKKILILTLLHLLSTLHNHQVASFQPTEKELEDTLRIVLNSNEYSSLQIQALRRELLRILEKEYDLLPQYNDVYGNQDKRSIANLAKNGQLPTLQPEESTETEEEKRSIASLARTGLVGPRPLRNYYDDYYSEIKRHLGSLLKQYQAKRNVGSLARNGEINGKRNVQSVMRDRGTEAGKRNIGSLLRNSQNYYPFRDYADKRNIGSIARDWSLPNHSSGWAKRNAAALLRQDSYLEANRQHHDESESSDMDDEESPISKKSVASLRAHGNYYPGRTIEKRSVQTKQRVKRQAEEFGGVPLSYYDISDYFNNNYEKRFLGSIPLSRMADLGMMEEGQIKSTPSTTAYRRRQYLLARPGGD